MKKTYFTTLLFALSFYMLSAQEQKQDSISPAKEMQHATTANTSIAKSLGLFVFPNENQDQETQDADEFASYKWAMQQTGFDPMNPTKVLPEETDDAPDGSALVGGAKGAAAGAVIGAISGDAGKGAAIGSVVGGMAGMRSGRYSNQVEKQQKEKAAAEKETKMLEDFKKAFSASMEAKDYTVK